MTMPKRLVLFVDDDVLTQWIMTDALTEAGFTVVSACLPSEAIEHLNASPEFDVLLADLDLPEGSRGLELSGYWCSRFPGRPVIYTGKRPSPPGGTLAQHEHFIEKPLSAAKLLQLIEWALEDARFRPLTRTHGCAHQLH